MLTEPAVRPEERHEPLEQVKVKAAITTKFVRSAMLPESVQ